MALVTNDTPTVLKHAKEWKGPGSVKHKNWSAGGQTAWEIDNSSTSETLLSLYFTINVKKDDRNIPMDD